MGTLVSEMAWMREAVLRSTKGMTQDQLDFLLDNKANRIGALLLHLAATEKLYQLNTFDNVGPDALDKSPAFKTGSCRWISANPHARLSRATVSIITSICCMRVAKKLWLNSANGTMLGFWR
jgi:hypothetical protein